jgi:hypothetical protein
LKIPCWPPSRPKGGFNLKRECFLKKPVENPKGGRKSNLKEGVFQREGVFRPAKRETTLGENQRVVLTSNNGRPARKAKDTKGSPPLGKK